MIGVLFFFFFFFFSSWPATVLTHAFAADKTGKEFPVCMAARCFVWQRSTCVQQSSTTLEDASTVCLSCAGKGSGKKILLPFQLAVLIFIYGHAVP
jgi:hypothetical protein